MVKVDLITGFLGSGKTTFLIKYVKYLLSRGERVGVLEYDYGSVNVDMVLLGSLRGANCELEMLAAACDEDCLKRRFKTKLIAMAMSGYTRVVIEPSGIFDMDLFFDTLRDEPLDEWYEIGNVLTVVDATADDITDAESNFMLASQAADAGIIILSKTQLTDRGQIERVKEHIADAAASIKCNKYSGCFFEKNWDDITDEDMAMISGAGYRINDYVKITAGGSGTFSSVSFLEIPYGLDELKEKITELFENSEYGNVLRVKGFLVDGKESYQINATRTKINVETKTTGLTSLIVIGTDLDHERIRKWGQ